MCELEGAHQNWEVLNSELGSAQFRIGRCLIYPNRGARDPVARVVVILSRLGAGPAAIAFAYGDLPCCDVVHVWEDCFPAVYEASKRRPPALVIFEELGGIVQALKATGGKARTDGASSRPCAFWPASSSLAAKDWPPTK